MPHAGRQLQLAAAQTHTVVLPHTLAYNAAAAPEAMQRVARALGSHDAAQGTYDLACKNGAPVGLKELGMSEADLDRAADLASANPYWNPRPVDRVGLRSLLQDAFDGARPRASAR